MWVITYVRHFGNQPFLKLFFLIDIIIEASKHSWENNNEKWKDFALLLKSS